MITNLASELAVKPASWPVAVHTVPRVKSERQTLDELLPPPVGPEVYTS
jgi:hypothetical protein